MNTFTLLARKQSSNMYLLDTTHCCRFLNGDSNVVRKLHELDDTLVATCVIVRGELVFGAHKSQRTAENLHAAMQFLGAMEIYEIDEQTADVYGELKAMILNYFGPKEKVKRRRTKTETLGFTENDLWIAAVAKRRGLIVVSADADFQRLKEVDDLKVESW